MTDNENAANIRLQHLFREVSKLWRGEPSEIKNAEDAYAMCREICELTNKERQRNGVAERAVCDGGNIRHERRGGDKAMREILFRGKRVDNGEWVYGAYYGLCRITNKAGDFGYEHLMRQSDNEPLYRVDPETVGEYTGMKDKNGERIFEGDIIAPTVPSNIPPCEVMFDVAEGQFVVKYACADHHGTLANFGRMTDNHYKVIGNKWDNPELLEEGE